MNAPRFLPREIRSRAASVPASLIDLLVAEVCAVAEIEFHPTALRELRDRLAVNLPAVLREAKEKQLPLL
jgi:hypothetical protein